MLVEQFFLYLILLFSLLPAFIILDESDLLYLLAMIIQSSPSLVDRLIYLAPWILYCVDMFERVNSMVVDIVEKVPDAISDRFLQHR